MTLDGDRVGELSRIALSDESERMGKILATAREVLGMQVAYFSQVTTDEQVIQRVSGDAGGMDIGDGARHALEDTYCRRMLAEEIPQIVADAAAEPALAGIADAATPVAYIGVPLHLSTGRVYGTLCCASEQRNDTLRDRDVAFMRVLARLLADVIEHPPPLHPEWAADEPGALVHGNARLAHLAFWVVATPRAVHAARRSLDCLSDWVPVEHMRELLLVVSELVTNSIRHAGLDASSAVGIDVLVTPGRLRGMVCDPGVGFDPAALAPPVPGRPGGWGLHIVAETARAWSVERRESGGVAVSFELDLGQPESSELR